MDATDTTEGDPDSGPARISIAPPQRGDAERVAGRFRCEMPEGWAATGTLSRTWRGLAISELTVEPWIEVDDEPGHITSKLLRKIPTGAIIAAAQSAGLVVVDTNVLAELPEPKRQPGRQPLSDELLRDVAEKYLKETAPGKPRGSITRLAEQYDKPKPMIARWVMRARQDGWLGPAAPGREGGEPGPRLLQARQDEEAIRAAAEQESAQQSGKLPFMSITMEEHARRMQQIAPAMGRINALLNALAPPAPKKADEPVEHDAE